MKRLDIVQRVLEKPEHSRYTAKFVGQVFDGILEEISMTLENGEDVKITGFGTFIVRKINDRPGRNPKTGEPVLIPAHHTVLFHPSRSLLKVSGKSEKK
jgi:integration host factor subunit alpha